MNANSLPADWGVFAMSLRDGRVLYARNADRSFVPASNMKLYTTAVALDLLGADFRWRTSVYAPSLPDKSGTIDGDLTLYGRAAPDLALAVKGKEASLKLLADELYRRGLRHVRGNVIGDESFIRGEPLGDGWLWNDVQWYYGAEVSALSIGGNEVTMTIAPGAKPADPARLSIVPETSYVTLSNDVRTVVRNGPAAIGITRGLSDNTFRVWGDLPVHGSGIRARVAVHRPALWAAEMFREELRTRGIVVDGVVATRNAIDQRAGDKFDTQNQTELASLASGPLAEVSSVINKESVNLEAELVLRTLGKEKGATAPDPDPRKMALRGDDEAGLAVVRKWLEGAGISTTNISLHDGSGLSRLNLVTPETTGRLLAAMSKSTQATIFRNSLAVAGRDGTLSNRLRSATARIFAKTGTLTYVNSLSGYVVTQDNEVLVFSIFCNNDSSPSGSTSTIDSVALLLSSYRQGS